MSRKSMCIHVSVLAAVLAAVLVAAAPLRAAESDDLLFAHTVFFKCKERTKEARAELVAGCDKFLSGHRGVMYYAAGVIAEDMNRDVNDKDFDVSLQVVFRNKAAHDSYQKDARHLKFIAEYSETWTQVRVFDSYVKPLPRSRRTRPTPDPRPTRIPLPDAAAHFAGMIKAEVVARDRGGLVVVVKEVVKAWEHNKAKDAKAMVGKKVRVVANRARTDQASLVARYLRTLKPGDVVTLDVANKAGEDLTLLELDEKQREEAAKRPVPTTRSRRSTTRSSRRSSSADSEK